MQRLRKATRCDPGLMGLKFLVTEREMAVKQDPGPTEYRAMVALKRRLLAPLVLRTFVSS